jgi:hypothetical protein
MSRGIGAHAKKILEDDKTVIYEYGGYNLNEPEYGNENHILDGNITILKKCFVEPEIHKKLKKMPSGRKKLITKRIPVSVDYGKMLEDGSVKVDNCSCCWKITEDDLSVDVMACHILFKMFRIYQEEGKIPEYISYNV